MDCCRSGSRGRGAGSRSRRGRRCVERRRRALRVEKDTEDLLGLTVGKAAEQDPRFFDAISRAMEKTRTKTNYNHPKGVAVIVHLDLRDLWDAIQGIR